MHKYQVLHQDPCFKRWPEIKNSPCACVKAPSNVILRTNRVFHAQMRMSIGRIFFVVVVMDERPGPHSKGIRTHILKISPGDSHVWKAIFQGACCLINFPVLATNTGCWTNPEMHTSHPTLHVTMEWKGRTLSSCICGSGQL